jgi:hypothetical protein
MRRVVLSDGLAGGGGAEHAGEVMPRVAGLDLGDLLRRVGGADPSSGGEAGSRLIAVA